MQIYLVRHGETDWNDLGRMQGHRDVPLNARGLAQAERVANAFEGIPVEEILSSDLSRATATARAIARVTGASVTEDPALRERNFGEWEGLPNAYLVERTHEVSEYIQISYLQVRPPGGESIADLWRRVAPVIETLNATDKTVVLVTHGGTCAALLARLIHANLETVRAFRFVNASITELERRPRERIYFVLRYNDAAHLGGL